MYSQHLLRRLNGRDLGARKQSCQHRLRLGVQHVPNPWAGSRWHDDAGFRILPHVMAEIELDLEHKPVQLGFRRG